MTAKFDLPERLCKRPACPYLWIFIKLQMYAGLAICPSFSPAGIGSSAQCRATITAGAGSWRSPSSIAGCCIGRPFGATGRDRLIGPYRPIGEKGGLWAALGVPLTGGQGEGSSVRVPSSPPTPIHHQIVRHMYILYTDTNGPLPKILLVPLHPRLPTLSTVRNPSKDLPSKCNFCGPCL